MSKPKAIVNWAGEDFGSDREKQLGFVVLM